MGKFVSEINTMSNPAGVVAGAASCRMRTSSRPGPRSRSTRRVRERLLAQALLSLTVRQQLPFEAGAAPRPLLLMEGRPAPARPRSRAASPTRSRSGFPAASTTFAEIDPHALTSSALGRSQQAVAKLFEQTMPELAMDGVAIVLLDEA